MEKNLVSNRRRQTDLRKFFRVMKFCLCMLLGTLFSESANALAQRIKMTVEKQQADLISVVSEVCKKTVFKYCTMMKKWLALK